MGDRRSAARAARRSWSRALAPARSRCGRLLLRLRTTGADASGRVGGRSGWACVAPRLRGRRRVQERTEQPQGATGSNLAHHPGPTNAVRACAARGRSGRRRRDRRSRSAARYLEERCGLVGGGRVLRDRAARDCGRTPSLRLRHEHLALRRRGSAVPAHDQGAHVGRRPSRRGFLEAGPPRSCLDGVRAGRRDRRRLRVRSLAPRRVDDARRETQIRSRDRPVRRICGRHAALRGALHRRLSDDRRRGPTRRGRLRCDQADEHADDRRHAARRHRRPRVDVRARSPSPARRAVPAHRCRVLLPRFEPVGSKADRPSLGSAHPCDAPGRDAPTAATTRAARSPAPNAPLGRRRHSPRASSRRASSTHVSRDARARRGCSPAGTTSATGS